MLSIPVAQALHGLISVIDHYKVSSHTVLSVNRGGVIHS